MIILRGNKTELRASARTARKILILFGAIPDRAGEIVELAGQMPGISQAFNGIEVSCALPYYGETAPCPECAHFSPLADDPAWGICGYLSEIMGKNFPVQAAVNINAIPHACRWYAPLQ